jgi:hypothetical protein
MPGSRCAEHGILKSGLRGASIGWEQAKAVSGLLALGTTVGTPHLLSWVLSRRERQAQGEDTFRNINLACCPELSMLRMWKMGRFSKFASEVRVS